MGPVTVGWVQRLLPDAVVAALLVEDGEVLRVAHLGRFIPAKVKTALIERDRACVVPGCAVDDHGPPARPQCPPTGAGRGRRVGRGRGSRLWPCPGPTLANPRPCPTAGRNQAGGGRTFSTGAG